MCTCVHFHTHKFLHITIHQHSRTLLWHAKINIIEQDSCAAAIGGTLVWAFLSLDLIKICCPYFETMLKNVILIFKDIISLQLCFIVTTQWLAEFVSTKKLIKLFLFLVHLLQYSLGWLNYSLSKPFTTLKSHYIVGSRFTRCIVLVEPKKAAFHPRFSQLQTTLITKKGNNNNSCGQWLWLSW